MNNLTLAPSSPKSKYDKPDIYFFFLQILTWRYIKGEPLDKTRTCGSLPNAVQINQDPFCGRNLIWHSLITPSTTHAPTHTHTHTHTHTQLLLLLQQLPLAVAPRHLAASRRV